MSLADELIPGSKAGCKAVAVATTPTYIVGSNEKRIALIISCPTGGSVTLSTNPSPSANEGLTLYGGGAPIWINAQSFGDFCQRGLFGIASAGTLNIGVVEVSL